MDLPWFTLAEELYQKLQFVHSQDFSSSLSKGGFSLDLEPNNFLDITSIYLFERLTHSECVYLLWQFSLVYF